VTSTAAIVSFRLGGGDGVAVEARKWQAALERIGFSIRRVAGELEGAPMPGDVVLPGLGLPAAELGGGSAVPPTAPTPDELRAAFAGADLVIVENMLSLPLNLPAAEVIAAVLADGAEPRTLVHHHDLPWQRDRTASLEAFPPLMPSALHVTINDASRNALADRRGIRAVTIRNCFDLDAPRGDGARGRAMIGASRDDIVVLHPVRAIARKNIPAAVRLANELAARFPDRTVRYWLPGPAEEGYGPTLEKVLQEAKVVVHREPVNSMPDAYAACDVVAFPSIWEGFGNPVIESVWARRPLAVARYPVLEEMLARGFVFLDAADADAVAPAVAVPDTTVLDHNFALAQRWHSLPALEAQLRDLLQSREWLP
jgi:glycosyltransferase involved in cell wall biosynthesis